jgi:hypothetical protein
MNSTTSSSGHSNSYVHKECHCTVA